jgi:hypothetical protein
LTEHADVPAEVVAELRSVCLALPETHEEPAWVGTRWRIRTQTFAHVLTIDAGWPPAYARAAETDDPVAVLTFESSGPELAALSAAGQRLAPVIHRPESMLRERLPIGPASAFAQKLSAFRDAGVQRVLIWPVADEQRRLELFCEKVWPALSTQSG